MVMNNILKKDDEYYIKLPKKLIQTYGTNVEIKEIYPNLFIIVKKEENKEELNEKEIEIIKKIGKIDSKERLKDKILKDLSNYEKKILFNLIKKKILFNYKKNNNWYLGISKDYFYKIVLNKKTNKESENKNIEYLICEEDIPKEIDQNNYYIVAGFDKKKYVIHKKVFNKYKNLILKKLDKAKTLEELSKELNLNKDLLKCCLEVLREIESEIIEIEKNKYKKI